MKFNYQPPPFTGNSFPGNARQFDFLGSSADDHIVRVIESTNTFYEEELLTHLALRGPRGGIFVDVGANIGNHALFFASYLADQVVCIEPFQKVAAVCRDNLNRNQQINYQLFEVAVGAQEGTGRVETNLTGNLGQSRFIPDSDGTQGTLPLTTLDSIYRQVKDQDQNRPWNLIKIDVEGMQLDVLKGATALLATEQPQLVIEADTDAEFEALKNFLLPLGYCLIGRFCDTPTYHFLHPEKDTLRRLPFFYKLNRLVRSWFRS